MRMAMIAVLALGGCATVPVATVAPVCGAVSTVFISKEDILTEGTATQIEANNLARAKLCGKSRPPKLIEPKVS